jgi:hypothetical protein
MMDKENRGFVNIALASGNLTTAARNKASRRTNSRAPSGKLGQ